MSHVVKTVIDELPLLQARVLGDGANGLDKVVNNAEVDRPKIGAEGLVALMEIPGEIEKVWELVNVALRHFDRAVNREMQAPLNESVVFPDLQLHRLSGE